MIILVGATTCVLGVLSAFLVSRCQRGRECRDLHCVVLGARLFALSFGPRLCLFALVWFVLSRPFHIWCKTYALYLS